MLQRNLYQDYSYLFVQSWSAHGRESPQDYRANRPRPNRACHTQDRCNMVRKVSVQTHYQLHRV